MTDQYIAVAESTLLRCKKTAKDMTVGGAQRALDPCPEPLETAPHNAYASAHRDRIMFKFCGSTVS